MKTAKILYASVLAGAVLFSGTACAANNSQHDNKPTVTAQTEASKATEDTDTANILTTVNGYYSFISNSENYDRVKAAGAEVPGKNATDEQLTALADDFEGFKYFDTSSSQLIQNAYRAMFLGAGSLRMGSPLTITAPADAVTVNGDKATLNTTWITVVENGITHPTKPESSPDSSDLINLVKKDDGSWVIVAKDSSTKVSAP